MSTRGFTNRYDVIIVGAGPAGTAAAFDLLEAGARVLILEKSEFPRKKACAGGLTPKALKLYRYEIAHFLERACRRIRIRSKKDTFFDIKQNHPLCYMSCRPSLDFFALNQCLARGAAFKVTKRIRAITPSEKNVQIKTDSGIFLADFLIGADGANSQVRHLTCAEVFEDKLRAVEVDVLVNDPDRFPMEFDFSYPQKGYFWIFPKKDHVNIGFFQYRKSTVKNSRDALLQYAVARLGSEKLSSLKGYPICTGGGGYRPEKGARRVLLAGDAAGLVEPLMGEGIYFALKSGQLCAEAIINTRKNYRLKAHTEYARLLKALQSDLRIYNFAAKLFYTFPGLSLDLLSCHRVHAQFAAGYAAGLLPSAVFSKIRGNFFPDF